jgi:hypothetical protein
VLALERMTPPYTGPLIATFGWMRTCVVARARMSGASVSATKADAKGFRPLGRCERRGPCPSLVASVRRGRSMLAVELITRSSPGRAHRHHPSRRARVFRRVRRSAAYRRRRRRWLRIRHAIRERAGSNSTCPNRCGTLAGATVPEAGARTENARFTAGLLIATFVALRQRAATRSALSGASLPATKAAMCTRACAPLIASFAAGVPVWGAGGQLRVNGWRLVTPGRPSPPSVASSPARCGVFADWRRVVAGDEGGPL